MEFFNKKEEVLDFQFTEYGKYLLSIGRLKPVYYAFFDDDILYDVSGLGMTENPSMAEPRIQNNTPSLKALATRTGAETRVSAFVQQVTEALGPNSDPADNVEVFSRVESFEEKGKVSGDPIGRSSLTSPHNPAWSVEVLSEPKINLTSSSRYLNDKGRIENTPQINIDIDYKMFYSTGQDLQVTNISLNDSNLFLSVENNYLMLEVKEANTDFEKENFEIEVFCSGSGPTAQYAQLAFASDTMTWSPPRPIENDLNIPGNVGYYFNVMADEDIPDDLLLKFGIDEKAARTNSSRLSLNRDIYTSDPEEPC